MAKMSNSGCMSDSTSAAAPLAVPVDLAASYRAADRYEFLSANGRPLRHARWHPTGRARGTVVLLGGRGEFIEKYATETMGELLGRGFAVASLDWRGQGLSDRMLPDRDKGHIDDFTTYVGDLDLFLQTVAASDLPRPLIAIAHSMGGHILLRTLAEHGPAPLSGAVVVSPMTGLQRQWLLRLVLTLAPAFLGLDERYLPAAGPFASENRAFAGNTVTHDERRYRFTDAWFRTDPRLTLGGPTFGWGRQALRSIGALLAPGKLEGIALPMVLLSAAQDRIVDPASHGPVAARIPGCRHVIVEGAAHEIMMETDPLREQFWQAFDRLADTVAR